MVSASGRRVLVFNGEIYNFTELHAELEQQGRAPAWRGHSDTETLLAAFEAWGVEQTLKRARGMFALALWDRQNRTLTLARDRLGEKPLYYGWQMQGQQPAFLFGSELKALREHPSFAGEVDRSAVCLLLRHNCVPAPYSIYRGISKLMPGHYLTLTEADLQAQRLPASTPYWSLAEVAVAGVAAPWQGSDDQAIRELDALLRDAIGQQMVADVPLGAFLSGGIDSALTLALAVDALGADRVRTVMMPSPYTADISLADAKDMASRLGVKHEVLPIAPCFDAFRGTLASTFAGLPEDLTEENIQARIRGTLLMAISNKTGWLVLTTGNKSELAVGYSTLYGDMAGGFAPLKDVLKTVVYQLSNWRNAQSSVIPERIITRPPSAELRPDQTDQDSLPPYDVLDSIIQGYMEQDRPAASLVAEGLPADAVAQVVRLLRLAEYKRQQGPVGPRVTARAFGRDWRYPITSAFREPVGGQGA